MFNSKNIYGPHTGTVGQFVERLSLRHMQKAVSDLYVSLKQVHVVSSDSSKTKCLATGVTGPSR